jgi:2-amino-4-hydroxy-6-hydroxymethyldihydropteridine diphosphokinase
MALKRVLSDTLTLYKDTRFPYRNSGFRPFSHRAVIGIGGNVGDVYRRFHHLLVYLERDKRVSIVRTGPILKNPPFGFTEQDDFLNSVIEVATPLGPQALLAFLLRTEKHFGRKRSFPNAPRTLDLDIIFYEQRVINRPNLVVPHPHWFERESVVIPLAHMRRAG